MDTTGPGGAEPAGGPREPAPGPWPPGPLRVGLVVDTGVDDALALAVAARHRRLRLSAVVAAAGNVSLPQAVANTRLVLDALGVALPVLAGSAATLAGHAFPARPVHGPDGLAGLGPPTPAVGSPDPPELVAAALASADVVVCCAPLTTLASLQAAGAAAAAPRLVVVAAAGPLEPNAAMDRAAAEAVLGGARGRAEGRGRADTPADTPGEVGAPRVEHYPYRRFVETAGVRRLAEVPPGDPAARLVDALLAHQGARSAGLGDAGALLDLARPRRPGPLDGLRAYGQLWGDRRPRE